MSLQRQRRLVVALVALMLMVQVAGPAVGPAMASSGPPPTVDNAEAVVGCITSHPYEMWGVAVYYCMLLLFLTFVDFN